MKILIFGLPGSGKSTLAEPLAKLLGGVHINADRVRQQYEGHDQSKWDFSPQGRMLQAQRMKFLSDGVVMTGKLPLLILYAPPNKQENNLVLTLLCSWILLKRADTKIQMLFLKDPTHTGQVLIIMLPNGLTIHTYN